MGVKTWLGSLSPAARGSAAMGSWPVVRQLTGADPIGRGAAAESKRSATLAPRTATADRVARSVGSPSTTPRAG